MRVTKYEHACLDIEEQGKRLIIDPGAFTVSLNDFSNICAIIVTHIHADHFSIDLIDKIQKANPGTAVYTVEEVANELGDRKYEIVTQGTSELCGIFKVSFFGGEHAVIHPSQQTRQNIGVLVNGVLYYPGDSLVKPDSPIQALALPAAAPWMKISETLDFVSECKPQVVFPTHNAILSIEGHGIYNTMIEATVANTGSAFRFLQPGEYIEL